MTYPNSSSSASADEATLRVMTYNVYEGTNFAELATVQRPEQFPEAVKQIFNNIQATDPAARAAAVAGQIARENPDLVGLQEASILRRSERLGMPATIVVSDQTQLLLQNLSNYEVIAVIPGSDRLAPSTLGFDVRLTYRTVMIARTGMGSTLKLSNLQVEHFWAKRTTTVAGVQFINTRGWASIDVTIRGRSFRFVTTHLQAVLTESPDLVIQQQQAQELLATAGHTPLPVVMVGDFNANATNSADPTFQTYQVLINADFKDAWKEKHPLVKGPTCCQDPKLHNHDSLLDRRVDLVLYRGNFSVQEIKVVGDKQEDRTPSGLWPSDHAGLVAGLKIVQ
jgi:endonuclease/exonuclease/phosphatase family metal-dependent hydrolase